MPRFGGVNAYRGCVELVRCAYAIAQANLHKQEDALRTARRDATRMADEEKLKIAALQVWGTMPLSAHKDRRFYGCFGSWVVEERGEISRGDTQSLATEWAVVINSSC